MNLQDSLTQNDFHDWICPNLTTYWQLGEVRNSERIVLITIEGNRRLLFSNLEGFALRYFTGQFTVQQVQDFCHQEFSNIIPPNFVAQLLQKLIELEILALPDNSSDQLPDKSQIPNPKSAGLQLKTCLQWIEHPDGYWILRNPEDVTFLQVSEEDKTIIEQLEQLPLNAITQNYDITPAELRYLLQLLTATAMLEGTKPPKPPKGKFHPFQLLSFKIPLFNPDKWLTKHVNKFNFIWTPFFCVFLCFFLTYSALVGISESQEILVTGQQMWTTEGASVLLPFVLLMMLVVSIHELAHAFTLKHYGGIVPQIGLLFMCLMPGCYTDTSDSYCLVKRRQRTLVVGAGVLCQLIIWAIALWMWHLSNPDTWLHTTSYLLMVAALFTVALNLNPMSKFDGYYLAVALTGINNLRNRSFQFYTNLLRLKHNQERGRDALILAAYAPFSFGYILLVFGHLWLRLADWCLSYIPTITLTLIVLWAIHFYSPKRS